MSVKIFWCGKNRTLSRIVLGSTPVQEYDRTIRQFAESLRIPVIDFNQDVSPENNDLWLGCSPAHGWCENVADIMQGRSCEATIVAYRLAAVIGTKSAYDTAVSAMNAELISLGECKSS